MNDEMTDGAKEPSRRWAGSGSRRWARVFIGLAAFVAVLGLLEWLEWPFLRRPVEFALQKTLKRDVTVGPDFGIRFIGPLRLRTDLLVIGPAPDGPTIADQSGRSRDLLRTSELHLAVPYGTLFSLMKDRDETGHTRPRPYIERLEVARLDAALVRTKDGRANWRFGPDKKDEAPLVLPEFGRLAMADGEIVLDDALTRLDIEAAVHTLEGSTPAQPSDGKAAGLEVSARGHYRGQALSARLRSSGLLPLADSTVNMPPVPLRLEVRIGTAELDFDGSGRDLLHLGALTGTFRLAGPSLAAVGDVAGVTLPTTDIFVMRGKAVKDGAIWAADIDQLSIGTSRLNGSFRYDPTRPVPKLSGRLGGARLSLPDLGPAVGAPPRQRPPGALRKAAEQSAKSAPARASRSVKPAKPAPSGGRVLPQRDFDIPSLAAMDADVTVALDSFDLGTAQLESLKPFQGHLLLENSVLTLKDILARTAEGTVKGIISLDARQQKPLWSANLNLSGVQLERFVKPRNVAERGADRGYISGLLNARARLQGNGRSTAQVLASLDGEAQLWVRGGEISHFFVEVIGLDVAEALGMLVRGDDALPMHCAIAGLKVQDGKIWPEAAVVETSDSTISVGGVISLADERLGLAFKTHPKDISPFTLRTPLFVEGSFAEPEVELDKASIARRVAGAVALAAVTPLAAILALVDLGEPEMKACEEAFQRIQRPQLKAGPGTPRKR